MNQSLLRDRLQKAEVSIQGGEDLQKIPVHFSNDSKWIFVCCGCCVETYSRSSHEVVSVLRHSAPVTAAILNPKNHMQLMTASLDGTLSLWDYQDATLLRAIDLGVPLLRFGLRPGQEEPLLFFVIKRVEMSVVGVSSHVTTERSPLLSPREQLKESQHVVTTRDRPRDFGFTHKGRHLATCSGNGKKLLVYDMESESLFSYKSKSSIVSLACHPSRPCIATGNQRGEIQLWYDFAIPGRKEIATTLHWHAHTVQDLCFTTEGTYLLSGGEEGVLVMWQVQTSHKQFRPRLGGPISRIACSPGDTYFTVSLQSNVIQLVSGLDSEVEGVLGGLRRALTQTPGENGVKTGLVLRPHSTSLVLNSTPGLLQFYDINSAGVSSELNVTGLNYVSRTDKEPLVPTSVEHVAFSPSGTWMATVEARDDGKTSPELRLKFWEYNTSQQRYLQNTCADPPHDKSVTGLTFCPSPLTSPEAHRFGSSTCSEPTPVMAVTTSLDGRFKMWVLMEGEREGEGEGEKEGGEGTSSKRKRRMRRKRQGPSWACRSAGYYHNSPCLGGVFSQDGSLLALNFDKAVTIWEPHSCELRQSFSLQQGEAVRQVEFGQHSCSQYLMVAGSSNLHVWNLLSCRLQWRAPVCVSYLTADPFSHLAAAFTHSEEDDKKRDLLYVFEPTSPTPLSVHTLPNESPVVGAAFMPQTWDSKKLRKMDASQRSTLFFMDRDQVLYSLEVSHDLSVDPTRDGGRAAGPSRGRSRTKKTAELEEGSTGAHKAFSEIFGYRKRINGLHAPVANSAAAATSSSSLLPSSTLFNAAPHVLPPPTALCTHFMKRLLPPAKDAISNALSEVKEGPLASNRSGGDVFKPAGSDEDEDKEPSLSKQKRSCAHFSLHKDGLSENGGGDGGVLRIEGGSGSSVRATSYDWLVNYFKSDT